jgi:hypothetical protein
MSVEEARRVAGVRAAPPRSTDAAELAALPRLPDTAGEVLEIAQALGAAREDVFLGAAASEKNVRGRDLSRDRVVTFATHRLVPGDVEGLTQPALALAAPEAADKDDDGLLMASEILRLRLDADWVVLSTCNTAAGASAGAEAVSGLGRAFFYAGARACSSPSGRWRRRRPVTYARSARDRGLLEPVRNSTSGQVVGGQLHRDLVARQNPDVVHPHLARHVGQDPVAVVQLHPEHRVGQRLHHSALHLDCVFLGHGRSVLAFPQRLGQTPGADARSNDQGPDSARDLIRRHGRRE